MMARRHAEMDTGSFHCFVGTMLHAAAAGEPLPAVNLEQLTTDKLLWLLEHLLHREEIDRELAGQVVAALRGRLTGP